MNYIYHYPVQRGMETIRPLFEGLMDRGYIGGSYAAYMVMPIRQVIGRDRPEMYPIVLPNDVDVFATSTENAQSLARFMDWGLHMKLAVETEIAYTYEPDPRRSSELQLNVQIVKPHPKWEDFPTDIINSFDMSISRAVLVGENTIWADCDLGDPSCYEGHQGKFLLINNPLRSLRRAMKYHKRGVEFSDWELLKLFRAWEQSPQEWKEEVILRNDPNDHDEYEEYYDDYDWYDEDDYFNGE